MAVTAAIAVIADPADEADREDRQDRAFLIFGGMEGGNSARQRQAAPPAGCPSGRIRRLAMHKSLFIQDVCTLSFIGKQQKRLECLWHKGYSHFSTIR
jgi:hypothetical protein